MALFGVEKMWRFFTVTVIWSQILVVVLGSRCLLWMLLV